MTHSWDANTWTTMVVFVGVYLGMILGGVPFLKLDRTGIALLGAIALVGMQVMPLEQAWGAIHVPTLMLLFAFMVISAQLRLGGFYTWVTREVGRQPVSAPVLLGLLTVVVGGLSAVFSNDIICLAMAPVLVDVCLARRFEPIPFLLCLACSANVGSALTLIGNPQNMMIGEKLGLSFGGYLLEAAVPVCLGLGATCGLIAWQWRGRWERSEAGVSPVAAGELQDAPELDRWQTLKGLSVSAGVMALFLATSLPRELVALTAAGLLLLSRKMHSRRVLGLVDWQLLVLFAGLFVVNEALARTGLPARAVEGLAGRGVAIGEPAPLFVATFFLSNLVSNVPAVMLLLPVATHPMAGSIMALSSTLAGNLLVVGSIANIIVLDAAERRGIAIGWRGHARVGVPVTVCTLILAGVWLVLLSP